jgi:release factor glutamine methyltransferase
MQLLPIVRMCTSLQKTRICLSTRSKRTLTKNEIETESEEALICLEIGCGSGYVSTHVNQVLRRLNREAMMVCTDVNADATQCTVETLTRHQVTQYEAIQCNLADAVKSRLAGRVDVLMFNPPYVPCDADEFRTASGITMAWAGGKRGREVLDRFLADVGALLSARGRFYLVAIAQNRPNEIIEILKRQCQLEGEVIARRTSANEQLMILKFHKRIRI